MNLTASSRTKGASIAKTEDEGSKSPGASTSIIDRTTHTRMASVAAHVYARAAALEWTSSVSYQTHRFASAHGEECRSVLTVA